MIRSARLALLLLAASCSSARQDATELRFWAFGREGEIVQGLTRDFEREHPGIRVRVQQIPWMAAHEKLLTGYVGETTPDVAQLGNTWIAEFAALKALEPLDVRIASSAIVRRDDYFQGIWATNVLDGVTLGIPWYVDTRLLFYRKDLLERAGVREMPTTWAGWRDAMRRVRDASAAKYAIFLPVNEWNQPIIFGMQTGSPLLKASGTRGAFADSAFRRAFEFYVSMFAEQLAPLSGNLQVANVYQEFSRGLFAMYITGPWNLGEFANRLPQAEQDTWATAPLPGPTGTADGVSMAGGSSLVMFRASRHKDAAWRLMEYLSRPNVQARFYRESGDLPPTYSAWRDPSLANNARARAFRTQLDRVRPLPMVPEWEQIASKTLEYAERAVRGAMTSEESLRNLDREVDRILEKRRWLANRGASVSRIR